MLTKAKIQELHQLTTKAKARKEASLFVIEGAKMFEEAPASWIKEVYVTHSFLEKCKTAHTTSGDSTPEGRSYTRWREASADDRIVTDIIANEQMERICDTKTPQGVFCVMYQPKYELDELLDGSLYMILEDLQDPGNLGTIMRTAEAAGVTAVIMTRGTVDIFNPKTIRSTMGTVYRVPFAYIADIAQTADAMKAKGIRLYAAHLAGKKYYDEIQYDKAAFMIGNEGNGLSDATAALADEYIKIPMAGKVESLNAAISASVLMYEHVRQTRS